MLFIGHTRFSLFNPNSSSWRATDGKRIKSAEEYKAYLFSDERLSLRSEIFINQSLPQIAAASRGFDVRHVVSYSDSLPEKYKSRLEDAAEKYPFLVLDMHGGGKRPINLHDLAQNIIGLSPEPYGTFRLDDDDLISNDYFQQMSQYITYENIGKYVSLPVGISGIWDEGNYKNLRMPHWPMHSMGLLSVCARRQPTGELIVPPPSPHNRVDRVAPVIIDSRKPSYFWVRHPGQDTSIDLPKDRAYAELVRHMNRYEPVPEDLLVDSIFPAIRGKIPASKYIFRSSERHNLDQDYNIILPYLLDKSINLSIDTVCDENAVDNNVLISFKIVNGNGENLLEKDAEVSGFHKSVNPDIGYYRYLKSSSGKVHQDLHLDIPNGTFIESFKISKWVNKIANISVESVSVLE